MNVIELQGITKVYGKGENQTIALNHVDLHVKEGEFVAIMGPSGSGKSTLLHIIGLLDKPSHGQYILDGKDVSRLSNGKQATIRNQKIGFVFQQFNLLPRTSVIDNVMLPTYYGKVKSPGKTARNLVKEVGLAGRERSKSNQLSGGQIQRVAIARALIMNPSLILADEPTGNLDSGRSAEIMELFTKINQAGATVVIITHEPTIAAHADRIINVKDGEITRTQTKRVPAKARRL